MVAGECMAVFQDWDERMSGAILSASRLRPKIVANPRVGTRSFLASLTTLN